MSKLEKVINSKNNSYVLSNLKIKKSVLNSKSNSNKNKKSFKIKYTTLAKLKKTNNKLSQIIIDFFLNINEMDNSIEKIRLKLYSSQNFSAQNLFNFLDKNSQKFLTLSDFKFFLRENQTSFSEKYLRKFIHNFDKKNDFCINFDEFLGIIHPKKNSLQYNSHSLEEGLEQESKKIFCELISAELQFVKKCFELSEIIRNSKDFTTYEAFKEIACDEKYININNLKNFFINKGVKINDGEINQLMFRIDKDNDRLVSYDEFKDIFCPLNNFEIPNNSKRNYNKDVLYQYDNDDENDDIQSYDNILKDNIIKNSNNKKDFKYNFSLKSENNSNIKENKENDKNQINIINKAEERYNLNLETDLDNVKNRKKQKKILSKTEIESNTSNSIHLYKENMKNLRLDLVNDKNEYNKNSIRKKYKSVNNHNYYTHFHTNNSLLEQTKSVLGISHNNILNKIKINSLTNNINKNRTNINKKKKIIEIEYEKDYNMETPIREEENKLEYIKEKTNNNNSDPISDSILNFDYSRSTNRDRKNGTYYFKQKNKTENGESNNKSTDITNISENENNSNSNKDKEIIWRNKSKIKNANKRNSFSLEYNLNNLFSFKDEYNLNNNNNNQTNDNNNKNRNNFEFQNQTFDEHNKKNNLNFNYIKNIKADIINNNINNVEINDSEEQKYLDSLENINKENIEESPMIIKKPKNQDHYNTKLQRNLTRNNIQSQIQNKNKTKNNNYFFKEQKNINNNINDNQNKSCLFSFYKDKNNSFNNEKENINSNIYNNNEQKLYDNCESMRCPKCKCIQSENENIDEYDNDTYNSNINIYNNNNKIKKYENMKHKSTSVPRNINNNYNLNHLNGNINKNSNNTTNKIYNRNNSINKINVNRTNNMTVKNIYRNPQKLNNNSFNTNNSYYYMESSYNNNNFKINQINNNINKNNNNNNNNNSSKFIDLFNLFLDFIKQDSVVETMRQLLSGREDSNLIDLFSLFDHSGNKLIFASDFIKSLKEFGMFINMDDITFLFRKFNKKMNESFDLDEFCEIVLPKKHSNEKIMEIRDYNNYNNFPNDKSIKIRNKKYIKNFRGISSETKKMLGLLFKNIIDGEKSNENHRRILVENNELSGFDLFNKIKKNYAIGIYKEDIANFMKKNKYKLNNNEIELLMGRFDKNKNGMIEYKEFIIEISPIIKQ